MRLPSWIFPQGISFLMIKKKILVAIGVSCKCWHSMIIKKQSQSQIQVKTIWIVFWIWDGGLTGYACLFMDFITALFWIKGIV